MTTQDPKVHALAQDAPFIETSFEAIQELHACSGADFGEGHIKLTIADGGGGSYGILNAAEWAFETQAEIDQVYWAMVKVLDSCNRLDRKRGLTQAEDDS